MPDIDSGNLGELLRQIGPLASSMEDEDLRRKKDLLQFEHSLRNPPGPGLSISERAHGITTPGGKFQSPNPPAAPAQGGFSPMQRMFQERDEQERKQKFGAEQSGLDRANKLATVMEEAKLRDTGETARLGQTLSARKEEGAAERGSREKISQNELAARSALEQSRLGESAADRAARASMNQADIISREKIAQLPSRTAPDPQDQFAAQVQNFKIQNPDLADKIVFDETSKSWKLNTQGMTPEQLASIQNKLGGRGNKPKMITQRNKKTGETRQVPVK